MFTEKYDSNLAVEESLQVLFKNQESMNEYFTKMLNNIILKQEDMEKNIIRLKRNVNGLEK